MLTWSFSQYLYLDELCLGVGEISNVLISVSSWKLEKIKKTRRNLLQFWWQAKDKKKDFERTLGFRGRSYQKIMKIINTENAKQ